LIAPSFAISPCYQNVLRLCQVCRRRTWHRLKPVGLNYSRDLAARLKLQFIMLAFIAISQENREHFSERSRDLQNPHTIAIGATCGPIRYSTNSTTPPCPHLSPHIILIADMQFGLKIWKTYKNIFDIL
jgi:hypothetical protein